MSPAAWVAAVITTSCLQTSPGLRGQQIIGAEFEPSGLLPLPLSHSTYLRLGDDKKVRAPECSVKHSMRLMGLLMGVARQEVRSHLSVEGLGSETALACPPETLILKRLPELKQGTRLYDGVRTSWRERRLLPRNMGSQLFGESMAVSQ